MTQKPLVDILLELLSVLVDFWCQQHVRLNRALMEKSMNDLAEHIAVLGQGEEEVECSTDVPFESRLSVRCQKQKHWQ